MVVIHHGGGIWNAVVMGVGADTPLVHFLCAFVPLCSRALVLSHWSSFLTASVVWASHQYRCLGSHFSLWIKSTNVGDPVCSNGCPLTTAKNFSKPWRLLSMFKSLNLFRLKRILPGSGGIITRVLSCSSILRKVTKSLYLRRTLLVRLRNAGMLVRHTIS